MAWKKTQDRGKEGIEFQNIFINKGLSIFKSAFRKVWRVGVFNLSDFKKEGKATIKNLGTFNIKPKAMAFAKDWMKKN